MSRRLRWFGILFGLVCIWACQPNATFFQNATPTICESNLDCNSARLRCQRGICVPKNTSTTEPEPEKQEDSGIKDRQDANTRLDATADTNAPDSATITEFRLEPQPGEMATFEPRIPDQKFSDLGFLEATAPDKERPETTAPDLGVPDTIVEFSACGNRRCENEKGENCKSCNIDCACDATAFCAATGQCVPYCGNGTCEVAQGENCSNCAKDCACSTTQQCVQGKCACAPQCQNKSCGDDGCGGRCGTCTPLSSCQSNKCVCRNQCPKKGDTRCSGSSNYETCLADQQGCLYWSKAQACPSQRVCKQKQCCQPQCKDKECGDDGCGGSCGSCKYGCDKNKCKRKVYVVDLYIPCGLKNCGDSGIGWLRKPDSYIRSTYADGKKEQTFTTWDACNKTVSYRFETSTLTYAQLSKVKIEVFDNDITQKDQLCHTWTGDFTQAKKYDLVDKNKKNIRFRFEVRR